MSPYTKNAATDFKMDVASQNTKASSSNHESSVKPKDGGVDIDNLLKYME